MTLTVGVFSFTFRKQKCAKYGSIDCILLLISKINCACEIKLGGDRLINEGAANLMELRKRIDTTKMKAPSFEMVLTAIGDYAYRRTDGVLVVPIGCLKD